MFAFLLEEKKMYFFKMTDWLHLSVETQDVLWIFYKPKWSELQVLGRDFYNFLYSLLMSDIKGDALITNLVTNISNLV